MKNKFYGVYTIEDNEFSDALDFLEEKYFHNGGDPDAEAIVNWNKSEVKEDGLVSMYATNSVISNSIKRCRKGLRKIEILQVGANLYFDSKFVRPLHMVLKVAK